MANPNISIPASKLFKRDNGTNSVDLVATITVTGMRRFKVRVWIATHLIRLAAYTLGCGVSVDVDFVEGKRW